jgi:hypothetical protein
MEPFTMMAVDGIVNAGIGAIGSWLAGSSDDKERQERLAALAEYSAISPPEVKQLVAQGVKESAMTRLRADSGQRAIQDETQARLLDKGRSGGLDLRARARLEEASQEAGQYERQQREGIMQDARARGTADSGEELMAMLQAEQSGADSMRQAGMSAAADADDAALQAMMAAGNMAGEREERDWGQQAQVAEAEDDIAMFNAGENNRFSIYNDQQRWNRFDAQMGLASARANAHNGMANQHARDADRTRQTVGGIGQAAGYGIAAAGQYQGQQPKPGMTSRQATPQEVAAPATIGTNAALPGGAGKQQQNIQTRRKAR